MILQGLIVRVSTMRGFPMCTKCTAFNSYTNGVYKEAQARSWRFVMRLARVATQPGAAALRVQIFIQEIVGHAVFALSSQVAEF